MSYSDVTQSAACRSVSVIDFNPHIVDQIIIRGESQKSSDSLSYLLLNFTAVQRQIFAVGP